MPQNLTVGKPAGWLTLSLSLAANPYSNMSLWKQNLSNHHTFNRQPESMCRWKPSLRGSQRLDVNMRLHSSSFPDVDADLQFAQRLQGNSWQWTKSLSDQLCSFRVKKKQILINCFGSNGWASTYFWPYCSLFPAGALGGVGLTLFDQVGAESAALFTLLFTR